MLDEFTGDFFFGGGISVRFKILCRFNETDFSRWVLGVGDPMQKGVMPVPHQSCIGCRKSEAQCFYRATLCVSAVFAVVQCPSICLSVTLVDCIHTAEDIIILLDWLGVV